MCAWTPSASEDDWPRIIMSLRNPDPYPALEKLSNKITFSNNREASRLPFDDICRTIADIYSKAKTSKQLTDVTTCIRIISQTLDNSFLFFSKTDLVRKLNDNLVKYACGPDTMVIAENIINTFLAFSKEDPQGLGEVTKVDKIIQSVSYFNIIDQKSAFETIGNITSKYVVLDMADSLSKIARYFTHHDSKITSSAVKAFRFIAKAVKYSNISPDIVEMIAIALLVIDDATLCIDLIDCLIEFVGPSKNLAQNLIDSHIDFYTIIENNLNHTRKMDLLRKVLTLIQTALRTIYKKKDNMNNYQRFTEKTFPFLEEIVQKHMGCENIAIKCIYYILKIINYSLVDIYHELAKYTFEPSIAKDVLKIACRITNKYTLLQSELPGALEVASVNFDEKCKQKHELLKMELGNLGGQSFVVYEGFNSFNELYDVLVTRNVPILDFVNGNGIAHALEFLKEIKSFDPGYKEEKVFEKLTKAAHEILEVYQVRHISDPTKSDLEKDFKKMSIKVNIKYGTNVTTQFVEITVDFAAIESWYNKEIVKVTHAQTLAQLAANPDLTHIMDIKNDQLHPSRAAALNRFIKTPRYKRCYFKIKNKEFSYRDNLLAALASTFDDPAEIINRKQIPTIEIIEGNRPRSKVTENKNTSKRLINVLSLLEQIHRLAPNINVQCQSFSEHIAPLLASPYLNAGCYTPTASMIRKYPFIFSLSERLTFVTISALDLTTALHTRSAKFLSHGNKGRPDCIKFKCIVDRDRIFEQGSLIMRAFAPSIASLEINFRGDCGIGIGPTQEFFTLFSQELCKAERNLWREAGSGGLFPSPAARDEDLYLLGLFVAKAFATSFIASVPFSPAFIRVCRKETIPVAAVDPALAGSLQDPSGLIGLDFTYPGLPDLPLAAGGENVEVTEQNVDLLVRLISDFCCGTRMVNKCQNFVEGFTQVVQFDAMDVFSPPEFVEVINGKVQITEKDLRENVEAGSGYNANSPQVLDLISVVAALSDEDKELFVRFITGTSRLPVGGLSALKPKLTIAIRPPADGVKPDNTLPSVMTCVNYLKLPEYSSREILEKRLLFAIRECQGSFELT